MFMVWKLINTFDPSGWMGRMCYRTGKTYWMEKVWYRTVQNALVAKILAIEFKLATFIEAHEEFQILGSNSSRTPPPNPTAWNRIPILPATKLLLYSF